MGCQWNGMFKEITKIDLMIQSLIKTSFIVNSHFGFDLFNLLTDDSNNILDNSDLTALAITATQMALIDLMNALDIKPDYIIGHSLGELACAYSDGCLNRRQTIMKAYWRSHVGQILDLKSGSMAAVGISWQDCFGLCPDNVWPVCHNSPEINTISGETVAMTSFMTFLEEKGIFVRKINSNCRAYHSPLLEPIRKVSMEKFGQILYEPKMRSRRWISTCVDDQTIAEDSRMRYASAEYFLHNMLSPVLFYEALLKLPPNAIVIELGPHSLLQSSIKSSLGQNISYIPMMQKNDSTNNVQTILSSIGQLYALGVNPTLNTLLPSVSYPVNIGTQSISPLIGWDHSVDWLVPLYPKFFNPDKTSQYEVIIDYNNDDDKIYYDHCVNGQMSMAAASYITLILDMMDQTNILNNNGTTIAFENVRFHKPVYLSKTEPTKFNINRLLTGEFNIMKENVVVVSGKAKLEELFNSREVNYEMHLTKRKYLVKRNVYKEFRLRGYVKNKIITNHYNFKEKNAKYIICSKLKKCR